MIGYILAVTIGLSLGLMGGGGSILTVPILVYAIGMDPKTAIALSLAIVGVSSLFGVYAHFRNKNVNLKIAFAFAPVAILSTFIGAKVSKFISGEMQLNLFAFTMLVAAVLMVKKSFFSNSQLKEEEKVQINKKINYPLLVSQAVLVGFTTGIVGVGGGFLIVPALVLLTGLPMRQAVGTSLFIISLNSISGFIGYLDTIIVPWTFLITFTTLSTLGIFIGAHFAKNISQIKLKKMFSIFLIIMGIFIFYKNSGAL